MNFLRVICRWSVYSAGLAPDKGLPDLVDTSALLMVTTEGLTGLCSL